MKVNLKLSMISAPCTRNVNRRTQTAGCKNSERSGDKLCSFECTKSSQINWVSPLYKMKSQRGNISMMMMMMMMMMMIIMMMIIIIIDGHNNTFTIRKLSYSITLFRTYFSVSSTITCGPGSSVGIVTGYGLDGPGIKSRLGEIFRTCPDRTWGPPSLLYNGYRVFPRGKEWSGRDADPSPPSSAVVKKE